MLSWCTQDNTNHKLLFRPQQDTQQESSETTALISSGYLPKNRCGVTCRLESAVLKVNTAWSKWWSDATDNGLGLALVHTLKVRVFLGWACGIELSSSSSVNSWKKSSSLGA